MVGRLRGRRWARASLATAVALALPVSVQARPAQQFSVPAGRLSDALIVLSEQAGISIAIGDSRLDTLRTRGIRGRYDTEQALAVLLAGSGYGFVFVDARTVKLVRQAPAPRKSTPRPPRPSIQSWGGGVG